MPGRIDLAVFSNCDAFRPALGILSSLCDVYTYFIFAIAEDNMGPLICPLNTADTYAIKYLEPFVCRRSWVFLVGPMTLRLRL